MYSKKVDNSNKVASKFSKNMEFLRKGAGLSLAEMAEIIGMGKSIVGNYEKGTAEPSASTALRIVQHFGITLPQLMDEDLSKQGNLKGNLKGNVLPEKRLDSYTKSITPSIQEHVVDTHGMKLVPIVDIRAAAGDGFINPETLDAEDVIRLPSALIKSGYHLCIRIKGTSMAPTYQDGGYLIIRLLDRSAWSTLLNERCYVVVDTEGKTYIKRVKNRFSGNDGGFIVLSSDNPDKTSHPNFNLHPNEIAFIWYVEWYFTAKMPNIHDQYYSRVSNLEDKVDVIQEMLGKIQKQLK